MKNTTSKKYSLPQLEHEIIKFWNDIDAPTKIVEMRKTYPQKIFLDGPPFATGKPHYGHTLVSTIKDTLIRYYTMNKYYVNRGNGWDCHGVPIEMKAKEKIGYLNKKELLVYGLENHNNVCKDMVLECVDIWYDYFERIGRWIDRNNEYKTMDVDFMESVIWVFKELYDKGLIFEGYKVMPYSIGCNTPLSHFEAKQNYKNITEMSVVSCFEIVSTEHSEFKHADDYPTYVLVWTTTPWTLPSNMAICTMINGIIVYAFDNQLQCYILVSKSKYISYSKLKYNNLPRFKVIGEIKSQSLTNVEYKPPFELFWKNQKSIPIGERAFRIVTDAYVKDSGDDAGTGFVHIAPCYGEDDFRVCCEKNIIDSVNSKGNLIDIVDDDGCFTKDAGIYEGIFIKNADKMIINDLKTKKLLFESKQYTHSYPHCYRTETPLIYKISTAWFLNASRKDFREKMLNNNKKINWMPSHVGTNSFDNWLLSSVDWCISRNRYWGTPLPIWKSDDGKEIICVGSIAELEKLSGVNNIIDLHIEHIDSIKIPSKQGKGLLSRVGGVLDCWFESGAMPYAQLHYPFENKDLISTPNPYIADFITESKDQTRGWFYTLTVLATALFDKPAFNNVVVTGIVNGTDGEKMSKLKGNYPDPNILIEKYGADTLRLYLLSTPVVKAETIKFDEFTLMKLQQNTVVKIYNMALFLVEKLELYNYEYPEDPIKCPNKKELLSFSNVLDKWIINKTGLLAKNISDDMDTYNISPTSIKIVSFIEQLTNWYLKMARERLKGYVSRFGPFDYDWKQAVQTLLFVMYQFTKISAPFIPFLSETVYGMLKPYLENYSESVHYEFYPEQEEFIFDQNLEYKFAVIQKVISLIREVRDTLKFNHRRPLGYVKIACLDKEDWNVIEDIIDYVKSECNVLNVHNFDMDNMVYTKTEVIMNELSSHLKNIGQIHNIKIMVKFINDMNNLQIEELQKNNKILVPGTGIELSQQHIRIKYILKDNDPSTKILDGILVKLDTEYTPQIENEHLCRLINTAIQMHRKQSLLKPWQVIDLYYTTTSSILKEFITQNEHKFACKNINIMQFKDTLLNGTVHDINEHELHISSNLLN